MVELLFELAGYWHGRIWNVHVQYCCWLSNPLFTPSDEIDIYCNFMGVHCIDLTYKPQTVYFRYSAVRLYRALHQYTGDILPP